MDVLDSKKIVLPEITYYSGILYHGSKRPIKFDSKFNYSDASAIFDGSFTLGEGLYFTDDMSIAKDYSMVRQHNSQNPLVYSAYMPDCKFLDFRGENGNLMVPIGMISQWRNYFGTYLNDLETISPLTGKEFEDVVVNGVNRRKINREFSVRKDLKTYLGYLDSLVKDGKGVDLRILLGSAPGKEIPDNDAGYSGGDYSPDWSKLFKNFAIEVLEVDGIIYFEKGEDSENKDHTTFVVYNLESVNFSEETIK